MDLDSLEYPRHLHGPAMAFLHVNSAEEARAALKEGWSLDLVYDAPLPLPEPTPEPLKRGPGRPKKQP